MSEVQLVISAVGIIVQIIVQSLISKINLKQQKEISEKNFLSQNTISRRSAASFISTRSHQLIDNLQIDIAHYLALALNIESVLVNFIAIKPVGDDKVKFEEVFERHENVRIEFLETKMKILLMLDGGDEYHQMIVDRINSISDTVDWNSEKNSSDIKTKINNMKDKLNDAAEMVISLSRHVMNDMNKKANSVVINPDNLMDE